MPKYLVEQNKSSTFAIAFEKQGWLPEWPNGADCKSAGYAFGGSNPSPPTSLISGNSSVDRALAFQAGGRGFEPRFPLNVLNAVIAQW